MKATAAIAALLLLAGCEAPVQTWATDQCLRVELFEKCMAALPAGPVATQYNDWEEVVAQCNDVSLYQARRERKFIKQECAL